MGVLPSMSSLRESVPIWYASGKTEPGAYRAVEHRALLCAENGLALNDPDVDAFLVAGSIRDSVEDFCKRYGVVTRELHLPH